MDDPEKLRLKKLLHRSRYRGTSELDNLVGDFAATYLDEMSDIQKDRFEGLLNENATDLYKWITGTAPVPDDVDHDVMQMMRDFQNGYTKR